MTFWEVASGRSLHPSRDALIACCVSVVPVERMGEFVDAPTGDSFGLLEVEPI